MKQLKTLFLILGLSIAPLLSMAASAQNLDSSLLQIQKRWAEINYILADDDKEQAFEVLADRVATLAKDYPGRAEPLVWQGIVLSTWAGAKGGLGALGLVKQAKQVLEQSLQIDDRALDGSAYTSLGSLYYQVPGWPIGFGDDDRAKDYLQKALAINPDGIDANYFYADFLMDQGDYVQAKQYLLKARQAAGRSQRPLADRGRQDEISDSMLQLTERLAARTDEDNFFN